MLKKKRHNSLSREPWRGTTLQHTVTHLQIKYFTCQAPAAQLHLSVLGVKQEKGAQPIARLCRKLIPRGLRRAWVWRPEGLSLREQLPSSEIDGWEFRRPWTSASPMALVFNLCFSAQNKLKLYFHSPAILKKISPLPSQHPAFIRTNHKASNREKSTFTVNQ